MGLTQNALGAVLKVLATGFSRRSLPKTDGTLKVPGLHGRVEVIRDRWGVPHIYAADNHDLFAAQGFVHAQDRLWQMEVNRRLARGRLAELFGEAALETDRATRTFGFDRIGRVDWDRAGDDVRTAVEAYLEGVNAFLARPDFRRPVEYRLIGQRPEPWTTDDVMAFARLMVWELSHAWAGEVTRAQLIEAVGSERAAELEVQYPQAHPITLPQGIEWNRADLAAEGPGVGPGPQEPGPGGPGPDGSGPGGSGPGGPGPDPFLARGLGSNSWVVSGRLTDTGHPYLCNDMHLPATLPGLWYEVHLTGGDYRVTGASLPGVPGVLVGHNDRLAWGMTLAMTDCEDLFVEKFEGATLGQGGSAAGSDARAPRYEFAGRMVEAEVVRESIRVKGRPEPVTEEVVITRHGPVIGPVIGYPDQKLAVQSMALQPGPAVEGWLRLARAKNWDDFVAAMRLIEAPQLNVTYADADGNTGYWVTGRVPVRAEGNRGRGMVPGSGWTGLEEWVGDVPFEEMPHALNPARGFVVSCNHKIVPDDYPHFLGSVWDNGYRARRVEDMLGAAVGAGRRLSADDFKTMQMDVLSLPGLDFVRRLEGLEAGGGSGDGGGGSAGHARPDDDLKLALDLLRSWDGRMTADTIGGTVYEVARHTTVRNLLEPTLGPALARRVMGEGFNPILKSTNEFNGHDTTMILRVLDAPDSWWLTQVGGRQALLRKSLRETIQWLRRKLGSDHRRWYWGRLHRITFPHAMAVQPPLDRVFNVGPTPFGGDSDTVCAAAILPHDPYDTKGWAPTFRQIVDLGDLSRSVVVIPPGQSGQLGSRHYKDLAGPWLRGEYHPMLWKREDVERESEGRLLLEPVPRPAATTPAPTASAATPAR